MTELLEQAVAVMRNMPEDVQDAIASRLLAELEQPEQILSAVMKLSIETRSALASSLVESLDESRDENVDEAWFEEIRKRIAEIDGGNVRMVPWEEARNIISGQ